MLWRRSRRWLTLVRLRRLWLKEQLEAANEARQEMSEAKRDNEGRAEELANAVKGSHRSS